MPPLSKFLTPRYLHVWLGVGVTRLLVMLPWSVGQQVGKWMGQALYYLLKYRRHIAERNIALCFPHLSVEERTTLVKATFVANSIGYIETFYTFWGALPDLAAQGLVQIDGLETLDHACQQPEGVLILTAHFASLDLAGALFNQHHPLVAVYQRHNNPLMDTLIKRGRGHLKGVIEREQSRKLVKALKNGDNVWMSPDQDLGIERSVFAPFFGQPTATTPIITRLVAMTQCRVIFYSHHRHKENYLLTFTSLDDKLTGDPQADAGLVNAEIEKYIRQYPEQYMWLHRRFKTRPEGAVGIY